MQKLTEYTIQSVQRAAKLDPMQARRAKLVAKLDEQVRVLDAAKQGKRHTVTRNAWRKNEQGEKTQVQREHAVRAWFFEQDGCWYVQCKYGAKPLAIAGKGNAVVVDTLEGVGEVLSAMRAAASAGEFDEAITQVLASRAPTPIPSAKAKSAK